MANTNVRAGRDLGNESMELAAPSKVTWGPPGPILRALGIGFALGLAVTGLIAFFSR